MNEIDKSATTALIQLASAQDRLAAEQKRLATTMAAMNEQLRGMNGSIRDHNTQLALGKQWIDHHIGENSIHDVMARRLDAIERLSKIAIAIPTIIVMGGAVAGILALVL